MLTLLAHDPHLSSTDVDVDESGGGPAPRVWERKSVLAPHKAREWMGGFDEKVGAM